MKFPIRYIPLAALLLPAGLAAQTQQPDTALTRTVVVEQEYAPLIQDASKVNVLPRVEEPVVTPKNVEYDTAPVAATQIPADTLPSYAARETPDKATPGYVRLGYGNLGNLDVYADYLFRLSDRPSACRAWTANWKTWSHGMPTTTAPVPPWTIPTVSAAWT